MSHIAFVIISACDVLEDRIACFVLLQGTGTLHALLCIEPGVRARSRHLSSLQVLFGVIETGLGRIEARLDGVLIEKHAVALILTLAGRWNVHWHTRIVRVMSIIEKTEGRLVIIET